MAIVNYSQNEFYSIDNEKTNGSWLKSNIKEAGNYSSYKEVKNMLER
jgi:hypothetical protein